MASFTPEEVAKHSKEGDAWLIIKGEVYDVSSFLDQHPGGKTVLLKECGKDATKKFALFHQDQVLQTHAASLRIGVVKSDSGENAEKKKSAGEKEEGGSVFPSGDPSERPRLGLKPGVEEGPLCGGTAHILAAERAQATFNVELMTDILCGGKEGTKRRRFIMQPLLSMDASFKYNRTRSELLSRHFDDFIAIHKPYIENGFIPRRDEVAWMSEVAVNSGPLMAHMALFVPTIMGQASAEQQGWWLYRALTFQMIGSYAQTELGHGSNVRGLRTEAVYDPKMEEFVLNTPTLSSLKWWNSDLGCSATHACVYAQLIIAGKEYGVHVFMVQVRDENHIPLPGIEIGDVGPKMGEHGQDTGYMRLTNVRIPRQHLMAKRQHVEADGTYVRHAKGGEKMHYLTMMSARTGMVAVAGGKLAMACTIATRYSCVRKQGFKEDQNVSFRAQEVPIMDYQYQQYRIMKQIALAYAIKFVGRWLQHRFEEASAAAETGDFPADIVEVHASTAGLKGLLTKMVADGIEDVRKCCGGHGYALDSGIAALSADYAWQPTAEGDFVVMLLQTARFLMKCVGLARKGSELPGLTQYMSPFRDPAFNPLDLSFSQPPPINSVEDCLSVDNILSLFRRRALVAVSEADGRLRRNLQDGATYTEAYNRSSISLIAAARAHCFYFLMSRFVETLNGEGALDDPPASAEQEEKIGVEDDGLPSVQSVDPHVKMALVRLFCLLGASSIVEGEGWNGIIRPNQFSFFESALSRLLSELRCDSVALVDAFDFPDAVLNSTIGRYDGNVYEAIYEAAVRSRINREVPFKGYKEHLHPHLDQELMTSHNALLPEARL